LRIIDLNPDDRPAVAQVTWILYESLNVIWPFPDIESAEAEVLRSFTPGKISRIALAYEFYQKLGFTIVGIIPDANGWGKPDILVAKRVNRDESG